MIEKTTRGAEQQLADIAVEFVKQNRSKRRFRIFLGILLLGYFGFVGYFGVQESGILDEALKKESPYAAEVVLSGRIISKGDIDAEDTIELLDEAFSADNSKAVILRLNSPGGSPVQAGQIYRGILQLKKQYNKKIYAVIDDICASGCYYIAAAADEIYADESSIVGSIGVIMAGFGAVDLLKKIGVERRLYTAGKFKGLLDPFSAENESVIKHIKAKILTPSHQNFINAIKATRGKKLSQNNEDELFSGLIWLAKDAINLGLIDGIRDVSSIASDLIGVDNRILFEKEKTLFEQLTETTSATVVQLLTSPSLRLN